jgi:hypothetical protein
MFYKKGRGWLLKRLQMLPQSTLRCCTGKDILIFFFSNFESRPNFDQMSIMYPNKDLCLLMFKHFDDQNILPVWGLFSIKFRAEISVMCQKAKVSA